MQQTRLWRALVRSFPLLACALLMISCATDVSTPWRGDRALGTAEQASDGLQDPAPPAQPRPFTLAKVPIVAGANAGYLPGAGHVTPDGAYTYTLPIQVPSGRGVQPELAIT